ncbi:Cyclic nucleotide-gated olfactory channel, putative [Perkinsus marinus ATCC 50983]|uniref:Cyclic nucleotide-gated olfactory channel, putative n=1 Tax=Perkinsus marinus (strain ATCC 50983 / TXsc) TaxID=423536 RepID=C5KIN9_PERM5|nr:Cyclic nucleotide-gated olfactory channel, putative [Perkinsus marinus ATCC 50983]EER15654.1 Cyclic nucleotide-gated olfactory channel, putative [Perkinsus marinus ATCC 50983]|eukprot:XP_002783858.1 Cyclic nucleotide-gated olfactory channel, putative [Perkinsus marinus ATCC 50983]
MTHIEYRMESEVLVLLVGVSKLEFGSVDDDWWYMTRIQQYAACLYFMISTITTVGYGDIHASNHHERVFCIICEIVAGNLFALFSGLLCSLILTYDEVGADFRARLKTAMKYMHSNNVDHRVQVQVRRFLERLFQNQANEQAKSDLLTMLRTSDGLRNRVLVGVMGRMLKHYKWFDVKITDIQLGRVASVVLTK